MGKAGRKIIDALKEAVAGNFASVTIDGQRWVKVGPPDANLADRLSFYSGYFEQRFSDPDTDRELAHLAKDLRMAAWIVSGRRHG